MTIFYRRIQCIYIKVNYINMYKLSYIVKGKKVTRVFNHLNSAFNQIYLAKVINGTHFTLVKE